MNRLQRAALGLAAAGAVMSVAVAAPTKPSPSSHAAAQSTSPRLPPIVARVNGVAITRDDVDTALERDYARQAIFALVLNRLLDQKAEALHLVPTAAELNKAYDDAVTSSHGQLPMILESRHMSQAQFKHDVLRPKAELDAISRRGVVVTDADVEQAFNQRKSFMTRPAMVRLSKMHVPDAATAKKAETELAGGAAWADVYKKYSNDTPLNKASNGTYGLMAIVTLPKEVQDAIKDLKVGQVSQPVIVPGEAPGPDIWKVEELQPPREPNFQDYKASIRQELLQVKAKTPQDVFRDLLKGAKVTDLPPGYEGLFLPLLNPPTAVPHPGPPGGFQPPPPPAGIGGGRPGGPPGGPPQRRPGG